MKSHHEKALVHMDVDEQKQQRTEERPEDVRQDVDLNVLRVHV